MVPGDSEDKEKPDAGNHAEEIFLQVRDEWIRRSGVRCVAVGGSRDHSIVVTIDQNQPEMRERIPDSVDGVPVKIEFIDPSEGYPL